MAKLKLQTWSNSPESTKETLREFGHKILTAHINEHGQLITYIHATLRSRPKAGDYVLYYKVRNWQKGLLTKATISADESYDYVIDDCVVIKGSIVSLHYIKKIIKKRYVTRAQLNTLYGE